ncbi:MAG: hypothetical protein K6G15_08025 [Desulfovibrio sp.]|nr:hypothetical protein [Desulfovibrio sp.]
MSDATLVIALEQIALGPSLQDNLAHCLLALRRAAAKGARVAVLPEACMRPFGLPLPKLSQQASTAWTAALSACARDLGLLAIVGLFRRQGPDFYNTLLVTGEHLTTGYDKTHLYDAFGFQESKTTAEGRNCLILDLGAFSLGLALCYDLRFPEHFLTMAAQGANVMIVCADWGQGVNKLEQWRLLCQARALDCTSYVLACGQAENHLASGFGLGHSLWVEPNGKIRQELGEEEGEIVARLDLEALTQARKALPVLAWRETHPAFTPGLRRHALPFCPQKGLV